MFLLQKSAASTLLVTLEPLVGTAASLRRASDVRMIESWLFFAYVFSAGPIVFFNRKLFPCRDFLLL